MLESVEIFVDISDSNTRVHDLIQNLADQNFGSVEFTVHVENGSFRLRLLNSNQNSIFDGSLAVEEYLEIVKRILVRNNLSFSIIEHLNLDPYSSLSSLEEMDKNS